MDLGRLLGDGVLDDMDYVRTDVNCMRWYVPSGNVGIEFTGGARKDGEDMKSYENESQGRLKW